MALSDLSLLIRTQIERELFLEGLRKANELLLSNPHPPEAAILFRQVIDADSALLLYKLYTETDSTNLELFLQQVQLEVNSWEVLSLTTAVRPTERLIARIGDWLKQTIGQPIVVEFVYEPSILAGLIIEWKGMYKDYSLFAKLKTYFEQAPPEKLLKN